MATRLRRVLVGTIPSIAVEEMRIGAGKVEGKFGVYVYSILSQT
jgi:hypothetical protein